MYVGGRKGSSLLKLLKNLNKKYLNLLNNDLVFSNYIKIFSDKKVNIGEFYFMIIGTEDTPYEKGFYPFRLVIPSNYPFEPPKVTIILPNDGHSRMNPNLYVGGKV